MAGVPIAVLPRAVPGLDEALREAGADIVESGEADAIVWTSPGDADELAAVEELIAPAKCEALRRWYQAHTGAALN